MANALHKRRRWSVRFCLARRKSRTTKCLRHELLCSTGKATASVEAAIHPQGLELQQVRMSAGVVTVKLKLMWM
jgi:hypothetical protein